MVKRDESTELSRAMKAARTDTGVRQVDVADIVTQARLSRVENGTSLPTEDEVRLLVARYGTDERRADGLLELTRAAQSGIRDNRLVIQRGNTLALQQRWRAMEEDAVVVRAYQPVLVLGALQTARYAAVAMQMPADSDAVRDRLRRQERYTAPGRRLVLIQTEGSLRQTVGSAEVMAEQLEAIERAARAPGVELGIIPADAPMSLVAVGGFHVYDDAAVVVGLHVAAATLTETADIADFRTLFDRLAAHAVWGDEARSAIGDVARWYR